MNMQNCGMPIPSPSAMEPGTTAVSWSVVSPVKLKGKNGIHVNINLEVGCPRTKLPLQSVRAHLKHD